MATLPMAQPQNPNQAAGASLSPSSYAAIQGPLASTTPMPQLTPGAGVTGIGASTAGQPFGIPTTPIGTIPVGGGITAGQMPSISQGLSTTDTSKSFVGDFKDTYGAGTGTTLANTLANLGTSENQAFQATEANTLDAANRQYSNLLSSEAARGISPDSSSHALATGDFMSQVNANLMQESAQMQEGGLQTIISALQGEGQAHGPDTSAWDTFGDVLNAGAGIAGSFFGMGDLANPSGGVKSITNLFGGHKAANAASSANMSSVLDSIGGGPMGG